jgi:hypothetical protein
MNTYPNKFKNPTSSNANPKIDFPIKIKKIPNRNKIMPGILLGVRKKEFRVAGFITNIIPGTRRSYNLNHSK